MRGVRKFQVARDWLQRGSEMSKRAAQFNLYLNFKIPSL